MRRSVFLAEPNSVLAGSTHNFTFTYITAATLPAGTLVKFDPYTRNGIDDWQLPANSQKNTTNLLSLSVNNGKTVYSKIETDQEGYQQYIFKLPIGINANDRFSISMGSSHPEEGKEKGSKVQNYSQRKKPFYISFDPKGKGDFKEPEVVSVDVRGNKLANIKAIVPSIVYKNIRFDIFVRFEDQFGNLTGNAPENTLIEFSYDQLRENLKWKLFVPETGFLSLPNIYFNEPGHYRLRLTNLSTQETYYSDPMNCLPEGDQYTYWGQLHDKHSRFNDVGEIDNALRYYRDEEALQFYATSPEESEKKTSNDNWRSTITQVAEFNEEERFVTMLGFQWNGEEGKEGLRQILYNKDSKPILRKQDSRHSSLKKIYRSHNPKDLISIPSVTMQKGCSFNFNSVNPDFEKVVEIYNAYGSSECTKKEGNLFPLKNIGKKKIEEVQEGSIRKALTQGHRFGFTAGGKNLPNTNVDSGFYTSGLTAIISSDYSRDKLFQALYSRNCYATTGVKILLSFNIAGVSMGDSITTQKKPGLIFNRHIHGSISAKENIKEIIIIRNGQVFKKIKPQGNIYELEIDDSEPLNKILLKSDLQENPFCYYYLRVEQEDKHVAWSSPIWIDNSKDEEKKQIK